jgi:type I restriction enzyme, S subunit
MKLRLKPYREYRDSGVPWLGALPSHWDIRRLKHLFSERDVRTRTGEERLLSLRMRDGLVDHLEAGGKPIAASALIGYKCVKPPEIVMNRMRAASGLFAVAPRPGLVSPDYAVFQPKANVNPSYYVQLFKSPTMTSVFKMESKGLGTGESGFMRLYTDRFINISVPLPPLEEQSVIARFISYFDQLTDRHIRLMRKLIAFLNELKQTITHQAVTRGLDSSVRFKPAGVEWLKDVPEHWEVVRLGFLVHLTTGFPFESEGFTQRADDIRLLRGINISPGEVGWESSVRWDRCAAEQLNSFELKVGDLVLGMDRPIVNSGVRVAIVKDKDVPSLLLQRVARLRPHARLDKDFLFLLISGRGFKEYLMPLFTGISVPHISPSQIGAFRIALPPVDEQKAIVSWVSRNTEPISQLVSRAKREIELLRQYHTCLVTDVVTGKLDVRGVELPRIAESKELEVMDNDIDLEAKELGEMEAPAYADY